MENIEIKTYKVGKLATNCYLVTNFKSNCAAIVDPGGESSELEKELLKLNVKYILLTHGHFDHILKAKKYREITRAKIVISTLENEFPSNNILNLSSRFLKPNTLESFEGDILVSDGDEIPFEGLSIKVMNTPGHTRGGVCYILDNALFSGDTLFAGECGYARFPTGNKEDLKASLNRLYSLESDYKVFPGHEKSTLLSQEREKRTGL